MVGGNFWGSKLEYKIKVKCLVVLSASQRLISLMAEISLFQIQDRPHRALYYILPSLVAAVIFNIPRYGFQFQLYLHMVY